MTIESFFEGFRPNKKAGRVYLRLRIYSPGKQGVLFSHLKHWALLNSYVFSEYVIQAASSTNIGWMVYSSQFTDVKQMKKYMSVKESDMEWGFKLGAVTNRYAFQDEKKTKKTVHVPSEQAAMAHMAISLAFRPRPYFQEHLKGRSFSERYLFTPQEH